MTDMPAAWSLGQEKWAAVPAELQSELCRLEREIAKGIELHKRRGATRQLELEELFGNAKHGPSIKQKLERYVGIENDLRAGGERFDHAILRICSMSGVHPRHLALAILHDIHPAHGN